ncbi:1-deoxy-D-xylulose-5-phosphate synthase [Polynucleobacter sp. SHI8]|uniref:1-deoxy-D-xylulose-5-phosphate synthase n=1 Tax=unclassified Polynucleobacter TaxID=2640945 RepID=UPI0024935B04|nr:MULTISPECIES: 1-deoxy-D-xylulose-5-phosphate synthase [unclassified Polynucleobacter]BDW11891.1 1-deoxy-D-xylulose-5-phosphate synthase [Polynucleobacter sp. SHI2]BDW14338.1 1-deoxy-D-xylulose-5-phosphate synthase [Polynucleobacter sp. SHI8]
MKQDNLLQHIESPDDLKKLSRDDLPQLANDLRAFILHSVSNTGGHLSSNLGTVELTIALHYVLDTPDDRLIWDVGHQSYAHKILTGRRQLMHTLRKLDGISGFPRRSESIYDTFGTAHSSTSISAAMGMARGLQTKHEKQVAVAVIGDGAMSAGMAFEALNNAGVYEDLPLIVILNDNDMSISPAVGALNRYLARLMSGSFYANTKKGIDSVLSLAPPLREFAKRLEEHTKGMVVPGTIFEEFGFNYIGPIDGHDLDSLVPTLQNVKKLALSGEGPQFLHIVTKKGQGYKMAEVDPVLYHGPSKFDPSKGIQSSKAPAKQTFTQVFGQWLCDQAKADERLIGITPAMREGSGLVEFEKQYPDRYYDVGIAEQHAVTFAAGLACEGLKPVVAIYSTFLQRGYDQLIHDVALQDLPVVFALDRAGIVGADGATHAGAFDIPYLRCIPNMVIMTPADERECRQLLSTAFSLNHPSAVRYPRGAGVGNTPMQELDTLPVGKAKIERLSQQSIGNKIAMLCFGTLLFPALEVAKRIDATVVNMRFVKPIDEALLLQLSQEYDGFVTLEEGVIAGGAGSACIEFLMKSGSCKPFLQLGLPDKFIDHGDPQILMSQCGLDETGIEQSIRKYFERMDFPKPS